MNSAPTQKTPKLRFPEFEEEWKSVQLKNLLSESKKRNNNKKYSKKHVLSVSGEYGILNQIEHMGRSYAGVSVSNYHVVEIGDVVYTKSPLKKNPYGIIKTNKRSPGIVSTLYAVYRPKSQAVGDFLNVYFELDDNTNKYLRPLVHKGAKNDMKISNSRVLIDHIYIPEEKEQKKIADFLSTVDEKIAALEKKVELFIKYKKGVMQQIFSQEIRFRDENGNEYPDWEEKKLGDIASFSKGQGISKADIDEDGRHKCIRYGELYTTYNEKIIEVVSRTNSTTKVKSKVNDILMPTSDVTPSGLATASSLNEEGVLLGGDILIIRSFELDNIFFAYYVGANKKSIMRLVNGVTVYHLYGSDLASMRVTVPTLEEQKKISDFITSIDDNIQLEERRLAEAKKWKKSLLQQMFV